jgi:aryl-alcohol dehydrogenase-like predicted oxidoreductase
MPPSRSKIYFLTLGHLLPGFIPECGDTRVEVRGRKNLDLVEKIGELATQKGTTPGLRALDLVLPREDDVVPIPGTKRVEYLDENLGAVQVSLTSEDLRQIDAILPGGAASGDRYHAQAMRAIDR